MTRSSLASPMVLLLGACTNAFLEPVQAASTAVDDHLTLHTSYCTQPPDPRNFPVKVLFMVDESGSMCVSDPPGRTDAEHRACASSTCSTIVPAAGIGALAPGCATNNPQPGRVQALHQIISQFEAENLAITGGTGVGPIQVTIVPFATNVQTVWPNTWSGQL